MLRAVALVLVPFVASLPAVAAKEPAAPSAQVRSVDVRQADGRIEIVVTASGPPTFQSTATKSPPQIVVDLFDTDATASNRTFPSGVVKGVEMTRTASGARLVVKLKEAVLYDVTAAGDTVTTTLFVGTDAKAQPAKLAMNDAKGARRDGMMGKATSTDARPLLAQEGGPAPQRQMTYIGYRNTDKESLVYARLNDKAEYTVKKEGDNLLVLEIRNATIPLRNNKNHLDTTFFDSPIKMITPTEIEDASPSIRIIIEMKEMVPYDTKVQGRDIVITFKKG
jgi:hypothetical protein